MPVGMVCKYIAGITLIGNVYNYFVVSPGNPIVVGPPLSKKSFPVSRVGKKRASREVGNLFSFFLISFFIN